MTDPLPFLETLFPFPPPTRFARALAAILACANSSPPLCEREAFYRMKDAILRRHGKLVGADTQHIVHECWGDSGNPDNYTCRGKGCRKCGGTGIYSEQWHTLQRWELGSRIFHRPVASTSIRPDGPVTIEGRVTHKLWPGHQPTEAALWLALAFDRRLFARMALRPSSCACGWCWLPMVNLSRAFFHLRMFVSRFSRHRCFCGRTWRQWLGSGGWCICRKCRSRKADPQFDDASIPF